MLNLDKNKDYSEEELKDLLINLKVSQTHILLTQKELSAEFCRDYLLNEDYSIYDRDEYLDIYDILRYQPHLKKEDLSQKKWKILYLRLERLFMH